MDINLEQNLGQNLEQKISQQMIQSVNILQMNSQELTEYIKEFSLENPLVDFEDGNEPDREAERLKKLEWLADLDEQNRYYYRQDIGEEDEGDIVNLAEACEDTLCDNLLGQLLGTHYEKWQNEVFYYIAKSLDANGFFPGGVSEITDVFKIDEKSAGECLEVMKGLEPTGVCSKDIAECLLKQLEGKVDCDIEREIISSYMEMLGKNRLTCIAERLNVGVERVSRAKRRIASLNPKPSRGFSERENLKYITPDVSVVKFQNYFEIIGSNYPAIRLNSDYVRMLRSADCTNEVRHYISEKIREIEQLQENIAKRNSTLQRIMSCLLEVQGDFFMKGKGYIRPYRMKEAAEALGVHESTVSRAVRGKYIQCCWGMFPMGYFFSKGISLLAPDGERNVSTLSIKNRLKEIIAGEDRTKPYSDQKLTELLKRDGIEISRRTVAKYRESMEIADCRGRRAF